jgi:hypothetical protein
MPLGTFAVRGRSSFAARGPRAIFTRIHALPEPPLFAALDCMRPSLPEAARGLARVKRGLVGFLPLMRAYGRLRSLRTSTHCDSMSDERDRLPLR